MVNSVTQGSTLPRIGYFWVIGFSSVFRASGPSCGFSFFENCFYSASIITSTSKEMISRYIEYVSSFSEFALLHIINIGKDLSKRVCSLILPKFNFAPVYFKGCCTIHQNNQYTERLSNITATEVLPFGFSVLNAGFAF